MQLRTIAHFFFKNIQYRSIYANCSAFDCIFAMMKAQHIFIGTYFHVSNSGRSCQLIFIAAFFSINFRLFFFANQLPSSSFIIFSQWPLVRVEWPIWRNFKPKYLRLSIKYLIFHRFDHFICFVNDICLCRENSMNYSRHTQTRALCVSFPRFRFIWFGCELQLLSQIQRHSSDLFIACFSLSLSPVNSCHGKIGSEHVVIIVITCMVINYVFFRNIFACTLLAVFFASFVGML